MKMQRFSSLILLGSVLMGTMALPARAQTVLDYDPYLAPSMSRGNLPPGSGPSDTQYRPPLNPTSPWGWAWSILSYPSKAGSWDEINPDSPLDSNSDGHQDISAPYYPDTWSDSSNDGHYDSCGYQFSDSLMCY